MVVTGASGTENAIQWRWTDSGAGQTLETWLLRGQCRSFAVAVPAEERDLLLSIELSARELGGEPMRADVSALDLCDGAFTGWRMDDAVSAETSVLVRFRGLPTGVLVGAPGSTMVFIRAPGGPEPLAA